MTVNIKYQTNEIAHFYTQHRNCWLDFYESERWIFERLVGETGSLGRVLDVGCAAGGLGRALAERFSMSQYVGVDINEPVIQAAKAGVNDFPVSAAFECADIMETTALEGEEFDLVCSLGVADWNLDSQGIINACWNYVRPGGYLIISLRLSPCSGINDISQSYQFIHFGSTPLTGQEEKANYVIFNGIEALSLLGSLSPPPSHILGYGYWGTPSSTAVTIYDKLVFTVFALHKNQADKSQLEIHVPLDLLVK